MANMTRTQGDVKHLQRYHCPKCGIGVGVAIKIIWASCVRCGKPMQQVTKATAEPSS